jgi:hypothetical protein
MPGLAKRFLIIIAVLISSGKGQIVDAHNSSFVVDTLTTLIDGESAPFNNVLPGDTLLFEHGIRNFILLRNFHGEADRPIVIINKGGVVSINTENYYGISIRNCQYFKFTGTGDINHFYGFMILRVEQGGGLGIGSLSSDFEIDHLSIENCHGAGINAKTDPDCSFSATREKFTQFNTSIHDNYISSVSNEGLYIGSTKYFGQVVNCDGKDTLLFPGLLDGVRIYNNIVKYTGWDGIQVSSASSNCEVFNNMVMFDSQDEFYNQMSGILLGGGSKCDCYNNFVGQGKGNGIENHGLGGYRIFNNIIVDAGRSFLPMDSSQMRHGIYVSDVSAQQDSSFYILNNDIINPKSDGIRFASTHSKNNLIASNLIVNPGNYDFYENGNTSFNGMDSYIMIPDISADVSLKNNYLSRSGANAGYSPSDYTLSPGSPLIDSAYADNKGVRFDFYHHPRPYGAASDIGAFEFNPAFLEVPDGLLLSGNLSAAYPNPVSTFLTIQYQIDSESDVFLDIYTQRGIHIVQWRQILTSAGSHSFKINVANYKPGIFLYTLHTATYSTSGRFIKTD